MDDSDLDSVKDKPDFKDILRAILRHQLKYLVHQLSKHGDEEILVLTTKVPDGEFSHLGSSCTQGFLDAREDVKGHFMVHCMKNYLDQLAEENSALVLNTKNTEIPEGISDGGQPTRREERYPHLPTQLDVNAFSAVSHLEEDVAKQQIVEHRFQSFNRYKTTPRLGFHHMHAKHTGPGYHRSSGKSGMGRMKHRIGMKRPSETVMSEELVKRKVCEEVNETLEKEVPVTEPSRESEGKEAIRTEDDSESTQGTDQSTAGAENDYVVIKTERPEVDSNDSVFDEFMLRQMEQSSHDQSVSQEHGGSGDSMTQLKLSLNDDADLEQEATGPFSRKSYSGSLKLEVLQFAEDYGMPNAVKAYGLPDSTVRQWKKQKEKLKSLSENNTSLLGNCRMREGRWPELETQLVSLIDERIKNGKIITNRIIVETAKKIAARLGYHDFCATNGWIAGFKRRKCIKTKGSKKQTDPSNIYSLNTTPNQSSINSLNTTPDQSSINSLNTTADQSSINSLNTPYQSSMNSLNTTSDQSSINSLYTTQ